MCCKRLAENTGRKKSLKICHLGTIAQLHRAVFFATKIRSTIGKKLSNSNISSTMSCPHNMANVSPLTAEIGLPVWVTPSNFNGFRVLAAFIVRYCSDVAHRRPTKLRTMFGRLLGCYTIHIFGGSCPLTEFCQVQNSLYVQVLRSPILVALLHGIPAAGVSQTLRRGTRNGITELSQRAPPIFGRAAITLGIGSHSSVFC